MPPVIGAIASVAGAIGSAATAVVGALGLSGVASALGMSAFGFLSTAAGLGASLLRGGPGEAPASRENISRMCAEITVRAHPAGRGAV